MEKLPPLRFCYLPVKEGWQNVIGASLLYNCLVNALAIIKQQAQNIFTYPKRFGISIIVYALILKIIIHIRFQSWVFIFYSLINCCL
ncbi:hypothetical protein BTK66_06295 [Cronobacter sakazakii]|uniref:Uncharacterized protein n=1 Tax=Cronobacter sakazakii TaxID=28141 RepID=A0AA45C119_CROSK|nr:hypothetical protein C3D71_16275 [Cronobacter sakazakii]PUV77583.1 hypothetical protein B7T09_07160 [Cronobacter sakazakii]PUV81425.1 hypothetical protein B7T08_04315 [Cronobacter sakazakii]PUV88748.1 hypothetical protein B7T10_06465 [Cronobacter sakazakii]PUV90961.1 hypothetical protein B7T11_04265 [Cronobacter sakazakii]